ncbi:hypothetical protein HD806DRAFT_549907 [Xylariaceae sp. AK1471]|nr:hypothetical protein HD806DRAFT_549907 [Xylariaceae sp. AK1471]
MTDRRNTGNRRPSRECDEAHSPTTPSPPRLSLDWGQYDTNTILAPTPKITISARSVLELPPVSGTVYSEDDRRARGSSVHRVSRQSEDPVLVCDQPSQQDSSAPRNTLLRDTNMDKKHNQLHAEDSDFNEDFDCDEDFDFDDEFDLDADSDLEEEANELSLWLQQEYDRRQALKKNLEEEKDTFLRLQQEHIQRQQPTEQAARFISAPAEHSSPTARENTLPPIPDPHAAPENSLPSASDLTTVVSHPPPKLPLSPANGGQSSEAKELSAKQEGQRDYLKRRMKACAGVHKPRRSANNKQQQRHSWVNPYRAFCPSGLRNEIFRDEIPLKLPIRIRLVNWKPPHWKNRIPFLQKEDQRQKISHEEARSGQNGERGRPEHRDEAPSTPPTQRVLWPPGQDGEQSKPDDRDEELGKPIVDTPSDLRGQNKEGDKPGRGDEAPGKPIKEHPLGPRDGISKHATRTLRDGTVIRGTEGATFAGFIPPDSARRERRRSAAAAISIEDPMEQATSTIPSSQPVVSQGKRALSEEEETSDTCPSPTKRIKPNPFSRKLQ